MLARNFTKTLWSALRTERRTLASKTLNPTPDPEISKEDAIQAAALDKDICLLVDEKDQFLGTATKRECHVVGEDGNVLLHRAFSVFLFNKRGDMLLQRRASHKVTYPDYYSNACCSHPLYLNDSPEDVVAAARRRLNMELGIPLDEMDPKLFHYLTKIHYHDPGDGVYGEHEIDHIFFLQSDFTIKPNPEEISEYAYIPKNEFNSYVPTLEGPMTPWFNMIRRHRLKLWWDNLHRIHELAEKPDKIHRFMNQNQS